VSGPSWTHQACALHACCNTGVEILFLLTRDRYEVVDMQQDRKIVFSVGSDLHHATEQLVFMPVSGHQNLQPRVP
jgi:hypothetical protein